MLSFWPGFRGIARYGLWSQLSLALFFALILDAFLVANFYWTAYLTTTQRNMIVVLLVVIWLTLLSLAKYRYKIFKERCSVDAKDENYRLAQQHYLRGKWFEAESLILLHLKKKPRDVEMLLLQATLYRHTKRDVEALIVMEKLERFDGAHRWFLEIEAERRLIDRAKAERAEDEARKLAEIDALASASEQN